MLDVSLIKKKSVCDCSQAENMVRYIFEDLEDIKHKFVDIAFRLVEAKRLKYYEELGYESLIELAFDVFGFERSTTYNYINLYYAYCDGMHLLPEYEPYSQTQLVEMLPMCESARKLVRPSDTVAKIRDFKSRIRRSGFYGYEVYNIDEYIEKDDEHKRELEEHRAAYSLNKDLGALDHLIAEAKQPDEVGVFQSAGKVEESSLESSECSSGVIPGYFDMAVVNRLLIGASLTRLYLVFLEHKIYVQTFDLDTYDRELKKFAKMYGLARVRGVVCVICPDEIR